MIIEQNNIVSRIIYYGSFVYLFIFLICFIPAPNHEIRIHDTYDSNFSTRHVLVNSGEFFATDPMTKVDGIMNGLPRGVFPRFSEPTSIFMWLFGSLSGMAITFVLVRLLALFGIWLFAKDHLKTKQEHEPLVILCGVGFATLPFFTIHGLTVAGIPLVLWSFYNLTLKKRIITSFAIIALFVLWSNFVLVGLHSLLLLGLLWIINCVYHKRFLQLPFFAMLFTLGLYVASDYMLFSLHYFNENYQSSRGEFEKFLGLNLNGVIGGSVQSFLSGDYSSANYFGFIFLPPLVFTIIYVLKNRHHAISRLFILFISITILAAFFINLLDWKVMSSFYENFPIAKVFNFKRFTNLLPGLFFITILIAFKIIADKAKPVVLYSGILLLALLLFFNWRGNISFNRSAFDNTGLHIYSEQKNTFNEFFEPELYSRIKNKLEKDNSNILIHYAVPVSPSKYAGISVLDDYQGDYPLQYKNEFRKIIEPELNRSEALRKYFDGWGSRCYMESAGTFENKISTKNGFAFDPDLQINTQQIKKMNCHHILSSILIGNTTQLGLELEEVFVGSNHNKTLFLYKLI